MIRRAALLLGMLSFGLAWIVGVWCGHSPRTRLESALLALVAGGIAGAGIGAAIAKIVLARLAEQWKQVDAESADEPRKPAGPRALPARAAAAAPVAAPVAAPMVEEVAR